MDSSDRQQEEGNLIFDPKEIPQDPSLEYLGTKLFEAEYKQRVIRHLEASKSIDDVVEKLCREKPIKNFKATRSDLLKKKKKIIEEMVADMSSLSVLRAFAVTIKTILGRLYHLGIHINDQEVQRLRNVAKEAAERRISLVFAPCHKSHVDYLVVSYVLYRLGIALPHIAAGDNLNMPFVGWVLRHNGAFFIRREWGGDQLYIAIMKEYINYLLMNGFNMEAFIEGTRSRTGKLLQPKFGFLKLVLESILENPGRDALFVPVNIGYDKVIETPSYVNELLGKPKEKESIFQLFSNLNVLQLKWGRIDVRFGCPFSLNEFIKSIDLLGKIPPGISMQTKYNNILLPLGYRLLGDINSITSIMPTAMVGTILLTLRGRGVGYNELVRKFKWLKNEITLRGGRVAESGRSSTEVLVDRAITVLSDLVGKRFDILESVYYPLFRFQLSYYRNQVIHLFIPECIVSLATYATIKVGGPVRNQRIPKSKLQNEVKFLSQLLRDEFVYQGGGLVKNLDETLERLISSNVFAVGKDSATGEAWVTLSPEERRLGRETFDFYCFLLWPFIETYWLCAVSLYTILPDRKSNPNGLYWIDSRMFVSRSQVYGKTLYYEGDLSYFESVNKETLGNCLGWLKQHGIIKVYKGIEPPSNSQYEISAYKTSINTTWISLTKEWVPIDVLPTFTIPVAAENSVSESKRPTSEWDGPLGSFQTKILKSIYDDDASIALTREKLANKEEIHQEYYDSESSSLDSLDRSSSSRKKNLIVLEQEAEDVEYNSWSQHRPTGKLWEFCETIGRYRREGKNRRDTSTVAIRVLRLAQLASQWNSLGKKTSAKL